MGFLYGVMATIAVILFLVWGFLSVLGNETNPASFVVGLMMDKRYNWIAILALAVIAAIIYYCKFLT